MRGLNLKFEFEICRDTFINRDENAMQSSSAFGCQTPVTNRADILPTKPSRLLEVMFNVK